MVFRFFNEKRHETTPEWGRRCRTGADGLLPQQMGRRFTISGCPFVRAPTSRRPSKITLSKPAHFQQGALDSLGLQTTDFRGNPIALARLPLPTVHFENALFVQRSTTGESLISDISRAAGNKRVTGCFCLGARSHNGTDPPTNEAQSIDASMRERPLLSAREILSSFVKFVKFSPSGDARLTDGPRKLINRPERDGKARPPRALANYTD